MRAHAAQRHGRDPGVANDEDKTILIGNGYTWCGAGWRAAELIAPGRAGASI
jgi:hypothetical protein